MMKRMMITALFLGFALTGTLRAASYQVDPYHTSIEFKIKHMMVSNVSGLFNTFDIKLKMNDKKPQKASVLATIDIASIDTRDKKRDDHLRSPDFFNAAKFPKMTFKSTSFNRIDDHHYKVTGNLTIKDVTKEVTLDVNGPTQAVKDPMGNMKAGAVATTTINRKDFGITFNKMLDNGGMMISDDVKIEINLELMVK